MMRERKIDELLETAFTEREEGRRDPLQILEHAFAGHAVGKSLADFDELQAEGFLICGAGAVELTLKGEQRARAVVRRHRLTERLFSDLLELNEVQSETHACELEHILSTEATDAFCTLLGHPPSCPHGKPIPRGRCCERSQRTLEPLVCPLRDLPISARARVVFIAPKLAETIDRLAGLGLLPGTELRLRQRYPVQVIELGEMSLALDAEVASQIFVQQLGGPQAAALKEKS